MQIMFDPNNSDDVQSVMTMLDKLHDCAPSGPTVKIATAEDVPETTLEVDAQAGVQLDKNGTPWIADVHSGGKTMKADGTWTKKRGVDDAVLADAESAARAKIAGTPVAPEMPPVEVVEETLPPMEMPELVAKYTEVQAQGFITPEGFKELYQTYNTDPQDIATNETARRQMYDHLVSLTETSAVEASGLPGM